VAGIDQGHLKAVLFQYLIGSHPVDACGFHADVGNACLFKVGSHLFQVSGKGAVFLYDLFPHGCGVGDHHIHRAYVYACG